MHPEATRSAKSSQAFLNAAQLKRMHEVMSEKCQVHGRGNFPTLEISLRDLVNVVLSRLQHLGVSVREVKMNGGAASHILSSANLPFNDIDLIFVADLSAPKQFDTIKECVLDSLLEFLPDGISRAKISRTAMKDAYVRKMVKVSDEDLWSLISLNNNAGRSLELKFVHRMRRQFEFSVDSFQIHLTNLLNIANDDERFVAAISAGQCPVEVLVESVFGDFLLAYYHLNNRLIETKQPELIRGGGLLKYCQLLAQQYQPASPSKRWRQTERYMCSRFFIDFPTIVEQQRKLQSYLDNHFQEDWKAKYDFLGVLYRVVDESTVCLMNHDLRLTLSTIENFMYQVSMTPLFHCAPSPHGQPPPQAATMVPIAAVARPHHQQPPPPPTSNGDKEQQQGPSAGANGAHQPKQTLLYVPKNASYWVSVIVVPSFLLFLRCPPCARLGSPRRVCDRRGVKKRHSVPPDHPLLRRPTLSPSIRRRVMVSLSFVAYLREQRPHLLTKENEREREKKKEGPRVVCANNCLIYALCVPFSWSSTCEMSLLSALRQRPLLGKYWASSECGKGVSQPVTRITGLSKCKKQCS
uniref:polynucleotide adenylyltransferase n=1 Tax=Trichuris muris TaxID=70415 RepID=A0A5S6QEV7_TRIMR